MIAVADVSPVFLQGLMSVLAADEPTVLGVGTAAEARDLLGKGPDTFVADLRLIASDEKLLELAAEQRIPVIVVVPRDRTDDALLVVRSGVAGLWDRDGEVKDLRRILAHTRAGGTGVSADVGAALLERIAAASEAARHTTAPLTRREQEILELMAQGASNRSIAEALFISENTVRNHVRNILDKLQASSRTEAVVRALRAGLVRLR